jgi:biotin synthase-like enzyme
MTNNDLVKKRNIEVQNKFYNFLKSPNNILKNELNIIVKKIHNKQWTNGQIYNILDVKSNCYNNCKYCYMKGIK